MARIKIELLPFYTFNTVIPIRITDINYGGHVGNDTILSLLHEARVQFLKAADFQEIDSNGLGLIMSDVAIEFKKELFYGNDIIVSASAGDFTKVSFELCYKIETASKDLIAIAKTGMVCFDYKNRRIARLPDDAKKKLQMEASAE